MPCSTGKLDGSDDAYLYEHQRSGSERARRSTTATGAHSSARLIGHFTLLTDLGFFCRHFHMLAVKLSITELWYTDATWRTQRLPRELSGSSLRGLLHQGVLASHDSVYPCSSPVRLRRPCACCCSWSVRTKRVAKNRELGIMSVCLMGAWRHVANQGTHLVPGANASNSRRGFPRPLPYILAACKALPDKWRGDESEGQRPSPPPMMASCAQAAVVDNSAAGFFW